MFLNICKVVYVYVLIYILCHGTWQLHQKVQPLIVFKPTPVSVDHEYYYFQV